MISRRPFLLLRISFPGRPIFLQFVPGVSPGRRHPRRVVALPRQTKVRYLERLEEQIIALALDGFEDQGWKGKVEKKMKE